MADAARRVLYLVRHGEATPDGDLTPAGRQQAQLTGERLAPVPLSAIHHSPLPRATETAQLITAQLPHVPARPSELVGDYLPAMPAEADLPPDFAGPALAHVAGYSPDTRTAGPDLAHRALERFARPADGDADEHELVVTHSQVVSWFVRDALGAPAWRWLANNAANAALTAIQYRAGWPASLLIFNDMSHLPPTLRWTGFPAARSVP